MMKRVLLLVLLAALTHMTFSENHMFYFVPNEMSWSDAQAYCRRNNHDLATLDEQADLNEMMRVIQQFHNGDVWIGLSRTDKDAPWVWSDQSPSTFIPWAPSQPNNWNYNQYCAAMTPLPGLNDLDCKNTLPFVCCTERLKLTVRLEVKSSQNMSDPAVMTEILLQVTSYEHLQYTESMSMKGNYPEDGQETEGEWTDSLCKTLMEVSARWKCFPEEPKE